MAYIILQMTIFFTNFVINIRQSTGHAFAIFYPINHFIGFLVYYLQIFIVLLFENNVFHLEKENAIISVMISKQSFHIKLRIFC